MAVGVALGLLAVTPAAAAGLGGVDLTGTGAETSAVVGCDTDGVRVSYQAVPDPGTGTAVTGANVTGLASACTGSTVQVTISDGTGSGLGTGTATVTGPTQPVTFPVSINAALVADLAVVVTR